MWTQEQVALMIGYSVRSSGYINAISRLRVNGYIEGTRSALHYTGKVVEFELERKEFTIDNIYKVLQKCDKEIFDVFRSSYNLGGIQSFSLEQIAESTPSHYSAGSSGFINAISRLCVIGVLEKDGKNRKLHPQMIELL
jgi:hypothetical protein